MSDYDPIPGESFTGSGTFDFTPDGGTVQKFRVKKLGLNFEREYLYREVPYNGVLRPDRAVATKINDSFTLTLDEPRNSALVDMMFGAAIGGTVPGSKLLFTGSGSIAFVDVDGGKITRSGFKCQVHPEGSFEGEYGNWSELQIKVIPLGSVTADFGTYDVVAPPEG